LRDAFGMHNVVGGDVMSLNLEINTSYLDLNDDNKHSFICC